MKWLMVVVIHVRYISECPMWERSIVFIFHCTVFCSLRVMDCQHFVYSVLCSLWSSDISRGTMSFWRERTTEKAMIVREKELSALCIFCLPIWRSMLIAETSLKWWRRLRSKVMPYCSNIFMGFVYICVFQ